MSNKTVFEFRDYKKYLLHVESDVQRGLKAFRSKLAKQVECQAAYVSQVLNGHGHFSPEQAVRINSFLSHNQKEAHFFMLLVQYARAGNSELRKYINDQLESVEKERSVLALRVEVTNSLTENQKAIYYSQWHFAAIHVLVTIAEYQSLEKICQRLLLDESQALKALDFLETTQLIEKEGGKYRVGRARIHLANTSPFIQTHHSNWRLKAIEHTRNEKPESLHYSSVISISNSDVSTLRRLIMDCIDNFKKVVKESKEQDVFVFNSDFFRL